MKQYFIEKISDINYRISVNEGNANRRLSSEAYKILLLPDRVLPNNLQSKLKVLKTKIRLKIKNTPDGLIPIKIGNIQNRTAVKYIKMLIDFEEYVKNNE
ncbi:MAG: hypothetical protein ISS28_06460 [Candidatus Cloacimonetes bacterium]|nr:hypothetical protein [Candidatus Cloacimonadota bacterium]MBL7086721.1 hypothetical protein [Candidatus Cloacimonadota bacterium]